MKEPASKYKVLHGSVEQPLWHAALTCSYIRRIEGVFHVTGSFKDPKDAATVLSGSRQDEVMEGTWPALGSIKIPILPRGDLGPPGNDKIDSAKAFTKGGSLNIEGKAAWDDHPRRQAETLAFLNQSAEKPVEHPRTKRRRPRSTRPVRNLAPSC